MKYVFISHKSEEPDKGIADRIYKYLTDHNVCCWYDGCLQAGLWDRQITQKANDCSIGILVASKRSVTGETEQIEREVSILLGKKGRYIIPYVIDDTYISTGGGNLAYLMGNNRYEAVFTAKYETEEQAFERLLSLIPQEITRLDNNPADFISPDNKVLLKYKGSDQFVKIPGFVNEIAGGAFRGCKSVRRIIVPSSVKKLGEYAFYGCPNLDLISGLDGVEQCSAKTFGSCEVTENAKGNFGIICNIAFGGNIKEKIFEPKARVIADEAYIGVNIEQLILPEGVEIIGSSAFAECIELERIVFPSTIKRVDESAFLGCRALKEVIFKGTVKKEIAETFGEGIIIREE